VWSSASLLPQYHISGPYARFSQGGEICGSERARLNPGIKETDSVLSVSSTMASFVVQMENITANIEDEFLKTPE
jgi:hypothetical protein